MVLSDRSSRAVSSAQPLRLTVGFYTSSRRWKEEAPSSAVTSKQRPSSSSQSLEVTSRGLDSAVVVDDEMALAKFHPLPVRYTAGSKIRWCRLLLSLTPFPFTRELVFEKTPFGENNNIPINQNFSLQQLISFVGCSVPRETNHVRKKLSGMLVKSPPSWLHACIQSTPPCQYNLPYCTIYCIKTMK